MPTWEEFWGFIQTNKDNLVRAYRNRPKSAWVCERLSQITQLDNESEEVLVPKVRKAWEVLGTAENRLKVLRLILRAGTEAEGDSLRRLSRPAELQERKAALRALQKQHRKAVRIGRQFVEALEAYEEAVTAALASRAAMMTPDILLQAEQDPEAFQNSVRTQVNWLPATALCKGHAIDTLRQLQELEEYPFQPQNGRRRTGPREKEELNNAFLELEDLFRSRGCSRNKASEYLTLLLHSAGIWSNPDHHGSTAKSSQLRHRSPL